MSDSDPVLFQNPAECESLSLQAVWAASDTAFLVEVARFGTRLIPVLELSKVS